MFNCQRRYPIPRAWLSRTAARAAQRLRIHREGLVAISFIDDRTMRRLHGRFLHTRQATDVLTFRYSDAPVTRPNVVGEILIAPAAAARYAKANRLSYRGELARYVMHGLLHWTGHDDRTPAQQRTMRVLEDRLLRQ